MTAATDIVVAKAVLRRSAVAQRGTIATADRPSFAAQLADHATKLIAAIAPPPVIVAGFLAIGDEIDTAPLLAQLATRGYRLCLPAMQGRDRPLVFRAWQPGDAMATVQWGIREPRPEREALSPSLLLVPLLAADRRGHRLGYGGGYYDRTLRQLRSGTAITAIGLAFDQQLVDAVPHSAYDERLDWVLTPSGPLRC